MNSDLHAILDTIQKEDNVFTKARLLHHLKVDKEVPVKQIAQAMSTSPSVVCSLLRLLKIPDIVSDGYYTGSISLTHLIILSRLKSEEDIIASYETVLSKNLTTAQTEELVRKVLFGVETEGSRLSEEERDHIQKHFTSFDPTAKVAVYQTQKRARLIVTINGSLKKTSELLRRLVLNSQESHDG